MIIISRKSFEGRTHIYFIWPAAAAADILSLPLRINYMAILFCSNTNTQIKSHENYFLNKYRAMEFGNSNNNKIVIKIIIIKI